MMRKSIVGEKALMKNGLEAEVIADRGHMDIDIRFSDGVEVYHKSRQNFRLRKIKHPNINTKHLQASVKGMTILMYNGMNATCKEYYNANDITVEFEDGTIVEHRSKYSFLKGTIKYPVIVGHKRTMNCGMEAEVIGRDENGKLIIRFSDGVEKDNVSSNCFLIGSVSHPEISTIYLTHRISGQRRTMNCGMNATVIEDNGANDITIEFDDGAIRTKQARSSFREGSIAHPTKTRAEIREELEKQMLKNDEENKDDEKILEKNE